MGDRLRKRNALRILVVGALLALAGGIWLVAVRDFHPVQDHGELRVRWNDDPRLFSGVLAAVGVLLALIGGVMLGRARKLPQRDDPSE